MHRDMQCKVNKKLEDLVGHEARMWKFTDVSAPSNGTYVSSNMGLRCKIGCLTQTMDKRLFCNPK